MTLDELGREWLALGGGWAPGMLAPGWAIPPAITFGWDDCRILDADPGDIPQVVTVLGVVRDLQEGAWPDLSDPATEGACLGVLRELAGDSLDICFDCGFWRIEWPDWFEEARTRPEAIVAALRALKETT